jgi:hypothetical protein
VRPNIVNRSTTPNQIQYSEGPELEIDDFGHNGINITDNKSKISGKKFQKQFNKGFYLDPHLTSIDHG